MRSALNTFGKAIQWQLLLIAVISAAVGIYTYQIWKDSDRLLQIELQRKIAETLPDWDIRIGSSQLEFFRSQVHLTDVAIHIADAEAPLATLPELEILVDPEYLAKQHQVVISKVRVINPKLVLWRRSDGRWNWQGLPPLPESDIALPEFEIENAVTLIKVDSSDGLQSSEVTLTDVNLNIVPSAKREFVVRGSTSNRHLGKLSLDGYWRVDSGTGVLHCKTEQPLQFDSQLMTLISRLSPKVQTQLASLHRRLQNQFHNNGAAPPSRPFALVSQNVPSSTEDQLQSEAESLVSSLGLTATADVNLSIGLWHQDAEPEYKALFEIKKGTFENPLLPITVNDLSGVIYCDNRHLQVQELRAVSGPTVCRINGQFLHDTEIRSGVLNVVFENFALDDKLRQSLSGGFQRIYDKFQPAGFVDASAALHWNDRRWRASDIHVTPKNVSILHEKFPYPVDGISGSIRQQPNTADGKIVLVYRLTGQAAHRTVGIDGWTKNPGLEAESQFDIRVNRIPIDQTLRNACHPEVAKTLEALSLRGLADIHARIIRPPGLNIKSITSLQAKFYDGSAKYTKFPFLIENLSGTIALKDNIWTFQDLTGRHDAAQLTGSATFQKQNNLALFEMVLDVKDVALDDALRRALNVRLKKAWEEFAPAGVFDSTVHVTWNTKEPPVIALQNFQLRDSEIQLKSFPYRISNIAATLQFIPGIMRDDSPDDRVIISAFEGVHRQTRINASGFADIHPAGDWSLRLESMDVAAIQPDDEFREALPPRLREIVECLDPQQTVSLHGMLHLRGTGRGVDPMTAAWDLDTRFSGGSVTTGVEFSDLHGTVSSRGLWNGEQAEVAGTIDFDSATVFGYHLSNVTGPFRVSGERLLIGSYESFRPTHEDGTPQSSGLGKHITAQAFGSEISVDAAVLLGPSPQYQIKVLMSHGDLEEYARLYMPGTTNLRGTMNGWIELQGSGDASNDLVGQGQLQISPAELYELPIIVQIFEVLNFVNPSKAAFQYARLDFNVANRSFLFDQIDLVGNTISLRGRGAADFDGNLALDFFSMLPRNQLPPPVSILVGQVTKGWVGVEVRGNLDVPVARIRPVPSLDGALRNFLQAFEMRPPLQPPPLSLPPSRSSSGAEQVPRY